MVWKIVICCVVVFVLGVVNFMLTYPKCWWRSKKVTFEQTAEMYCPHCGQAHFASHWWSG